MIVAHLSDLHLGFRAYDRVDRGRNVRERDVAEAFERAIDRVIELAPDAVLIAGDVFDRPDPSPAALVTFTRGLERLSSSLSSVIALVAGARDTARRPGDAGALAALESFPRVEVAVDQPRTISLGEGRLSVTLWPYRSALETTARPPAPDASARWNVLVAHVRHSKRGVAGIRLATDEWDYVALGSDHSRKEVRPHVRYSGSLERVGATPWREAADEKGFLTYDLERARSEFHVIPGRPVVALAPTRVRDGSREALRARLSEVIDEVPGGVDGKIVHLTLRGMSPDGLLGLQGDLLASLRAKALHLSIDVEEDESPGVGLDVRDRLRAELEGAGFGTRRHLSFMEEMLDGDGLPRSPGH